jgi:hypothetical protein
VPDEREICGDDRRHEPSCRAIVDDEISYLEPIALEEEDDLHSFAVYRGKPQKRQTQRDATGAPACYIGLCDEAPLPAILHADPARPVDAVDEPVHYDEQDGNRKTTGGRLDGEGTIAQSEIANDGDCVLIARGTVEQKMSLTVSPTVLCQPWS